MASDDEKQSKFIDKLSDVVMNGNLSLSLAIGHKAGLFNALATFEEPKICEEISVASGCKQRYVKEWLGTMVSGGIVDMDDSGEKFFLPHYRRASLTKETPGSCNFACHAYGVVTMTKYFDKTLKSMKSSGSEDESSKQSQQETSHETKQAQKSADGHGHGHSHEHGHGHGHEHGHGHGHGHGHSHGDELHDLTMDWYMDWSDDFVGSHFVTGIIPANEGLQVMLDKGANVLEIGCGFGAACLTIAKHFPNSSIIGTDISEDSIKTAQANAEKSSLKNITFQVANAIELPSDWTGKFDHVYANKVMHHTIPSKALREVYRVLKPGGTFSMIEIDSRQTLAGNSKLPHGVWLYIMSLMMFVPSEESGTGHHGSKFAHSGGEEGDEIIGFMWSKENIAKALKRAGFSNHVEVKVKSWLFDSMYICKK